MVAWLVVEGRKLEVDPIELYMFLVDLAGEKLYDSNNCANGWRR